MELGGGAVGSDSQISITFDAHGLGESGGGAIAETDIPAAVTSVDLDQVILEAEAVVISAVAIERDFITDGTGEIERETRAWLADSDIAAGAVDVRSVRGPNADGRGVELVEGDAAGGELGGGDVSVGDLGGGDLVAADFHGGDGGVRDHPGGEFAVGEAFGDLGAGGESGRGQLLAGGNFRVHSGGAVIDGDAEIERAQGDGGEAADGRGRYNPPGKSTHAVAISQQDAEVAVGDGDNLRLRVNGGAAGTGGVELKGDGPVDGFRRANGGAGGIGDAGLIAEQIRHLRGLSQGDGRRADEQEKGEG